MNHATLISILSGSRLKVAVMAAAFSVLLSMPFANVPASRALAYAIRTAETLPIDTFCSASTLTGGQSTSCTVSFSKGAPVGGASTMVGSTRSDLTSPGTSTFPYTLSVPAGASSGSFTLNTQTVSASTSVTIFTYQAGTDPSNHANWKTSTSITLTP